MPEEQPTPLHRLPFKTAPKVETCLVGNPETCGTVEFVKLNDLTVTERAWLAANSNYKSAFGHTARLAAKIAKAEKAKPLDAHAFINRILGAAMGAKVAFTPKEDAWAIRYARELEQCAMDVLHSTVAAQTALVTCIIRHRLDRPDWTSQDTATLPSELVEAIHLFAQSEERRGEPVSIESSQAELTQMLGELSPAPTRSRHPRTGERSTTSSETSTPATQTSPSTDSEDSSPDTSSTS